MLKGGFKKLGEGGEECTHSMFSHRPTLFCRSFSEAQQGSSAVREAFGGGCFAEIKGNVSEDAVFGSVLIPFSHRLQCLHASAVSGAPVLYARLHMEGVIFCVLIHFSDEVRSSYLQTILLSVSKYLPFLAPHSEVTLPRKLIEVAKELSVDSATVLYGIVLSRALWLHRLKLGEPIRALKRISHSMNGERFIDLVGVGLRLMVLGHAAALYNELMAAIDSWTKIFYDVQPWLGNFQWDTKYLIERIMVSAWCTLAH